MSRRLISRISRCRRSQSPKELTSVEPASQGGGRSGRLTPAPPPAAVGSAAAASVLRGGNLSCLDTIFDTRRLTLRGAPARGQIPLPWPRTESGIFLLPYDDFANRPESVVERRFRGDRG